MTEIWKDIEGYEGFYMASYSGKIKSLDRFVNCNKGSKQPKKGKILKPFLNRKGYPIVDVPMNGLRKTISVHILITKTFVPNPENKPQVNHKDGNKLNSAAWNLEWCTNKENITHASINGLLIRPKGEKHSLAKLTEKQVIEIRSLQNKMKRKDIAIKFNVGRSNIDMILANQTWRHLL